jgi:hypothetical protein
MEMPTIARARREPEVKAQGSRGGPLPAVLIISPSLLLADRRISGSHTPERIRVSTPLRYLHFHA